MNDLVGPTLFVAFMLSVFAVTAAYTLWEHIERLQHQINRLRDRCGDLERSTHNALKKLRKELP